MKYLFCIKCRYISKLYIYQVPNVVKKNIHKDVIKNMMKPIKSVTLYTKCTRRELLLSYISCGTIRNTRYIIYFSKKGLSFSVRLYLC